MQISDSCPVTPKPEASKPQSRMRSLVEPPLTTQVLILVHVWPLQHLGSSCRSSGFRCCSSSSSSSSGNSIGAGRGGEKAEVAIVLTLITVRPVIMMQFCWYHLNMADQGARGKKRPLRSFFAVSRLIWNPILIMAFVPCKCFGLLVADRSN